MDTPSLRAVAQRKYKFARLNLLLMIGLTVANFVLLLFAPDALLLFSAIIPYVSVVIGFLSFLFMKTVSSVLYFALTAITVIIYLLCWFFSKKHYGWMIAALVMYAVDALALVLLYETIVPQGYCRAIEIVLHIWFLIIFIIGVRSGYQLKTFPEDEPEIITDEEPVILNDESPEIE